MLNKYLKLCLGFALYGVMALSFVQCGGATSSGSTSSGSSSSSGSGGSDPGESADSAATAGSTASVMTATGNTAGGSASSSGVGNLVKARAAAQYLARNAQNATVSGSETMPEESESCGAGGAFTFSASYSYSFDDTVGYPISMDGDMDIGFEECAEEVTVTASDGTCDISIIIDGSVAADFTLDMPSATAGYDITLDMTTPTALSVDVNGETHTFAMDVSLAMDESAEGVFTGTMTIDGEDYDAASIDDITYSEFTMADLGC